MNTADSPLPPSFWEKIVLRSAKLEITSFFKRIDFIYRTLGVREKRQYAKLTLFGKRDQQWNNHSLKQS
jgi:hypothetical protein